jgi:hypothetical protein
MTHLDPETVKPAATTDTDHRDAGSGQYVTEEYAQAHPDTTVSETEAKEPKERAGDGGERSQRAVNAFDALPGDSEAAVDYPNEGTSADEGTTRDAGENAKGADPLDYERALYPGVGFAGANGYTLVPALDVELTISTPDGRSFVFREGMEWDGDTETFDDALIPELVRWVAVAAHNRFGGGAPS